MNYLTLAFERERISSSGLSSKRIILSPFTKEFRGEGHSYESLIFSAAPFGAVFNLSTLGAPRAGVTFILDVFS